MSKLYLLDLWLDLVACTNAAPGIALMKKARDKIAE